MVVELNMIIQGSRMSQSTQAATTFASCHYLAQHCHCYSLMQHHTSQVLRLIALAMKHGHWRSPECCICHWKSLKTTYCACDTRRLKTLGHTRENVTKCHTCHARLHYTHVQTSKSDKLRRNRQRSGHMVLTANCERLRTVGNGCQRQSRLEQKHVHTQTPKVKIRTLATHSGKAQAQKAGTNTETW